MWDHAHGYISFPLSTFLSFSTHTPCSSTHSRNSHAPSSTIHAATIISRLPSRNPLLPSHAFPLPPSPSTHTFGELWSLSLSHGTRGIHKKAGHHPETKKEGETRRSFQVFLAFTRLTSLIQKVPFSPSPYHHSFHHHRRRSLAATSNSSSPLFIHNTVLREGHIPAQLHQPYKTITTFSLLSSPKRM